MAARQLDRPGVWLRSQMRPYYGGSAAGVLWTMYDISREVSLSSRVQALLHGARLPTAVLSAGGEVLERSESLRCSLPEAPDPQYTAAVGLADLARRARCPASAQASALREALASPQQRFECAVQVAGRRARQHFTAPGRGRRRSRRARRDARRTLLVAEFHFHERHSAQRRCSNGPAGGRHRPQPAGHLAAGGRRRQRRAPGLAGQRGRRQLTRRGASSALNVPGGMALGKLLRGAGRAALAPRPDPALAGDPDHPGQSGRRRPLGGADPARRPAPLRDHHGRAPDVTGEGAPHKGEPLALYLHDVTAVRHLEDRLKHDAAHDPLTGLPNWPGLRVQAAAAARTSRCAC